MTDQTPTHKAHTMAQLDWQDSDLGAVPVSAQFDDTYYSLSGGLEETRHVFLAGNNLPARFCDGFEIAELGFGTGLNFLVTWHAWQTAGCPGTLRFTSFEAYPMAVSDMARALLAFPEIAPLANALCDNWHSDAGVIEIAPGLILDVIIGDARHTLPQWHRLADAWFLDGFSPAKNPALWEPPLLQSVADHTQSGGTAATYAAAGHVRRAMADAGFKVERTQGFGRKRHMTQAQMPLKQV